MTEQQNHSHQTHLITWLTGARIGEVSRAIYAFMALFLLLTSYYLVKPLRSSYYLKEFDPTWLPYYFLVIPIISLIATRIFNYFYLRMPKLRLIFFTYGIVIGCKLLFLVLLPSGGKAIVLFFYFWASVYFLLSISILWGCISTVFNSEAGERTFAFIAFGGMIGALVGSQLSDWLANSAFKDYTLLAAALTMAAVLLFLVLAIRQSESFQNQSDSSRPQNRSNVLKDLLAIWDYRYIRAIAIMVYALAFMNTAVEFKSQKIIDMRLARQQYSQHFEGFNTSQCLAHSVNPCTIDPAAFEMVYTLKQAPAAEREARLTNWLTQQKLATEPAALYQNYLHYHEALETETRSFFSKINFWINLIGMFLLLAVARPLFRLAGVHRVILLLPMAFMAVGLALFLPLEISAMAGVLIGTGTLNYSLNKTAKELLYTQSDDEARFRFKPLIEGPILRLGDVSAALFKIFCLNVLLLSESRAEWALLGLGLLITIWWLYSNFFVGSEYQIRKTRGLTERVT